MKMTIWRVEIMWLIDALYDRGRFLIASADADIADLYQGYQWQFEFEVRHHDLVK